VRIAAVLVASALTLAAAAAGAGPRALAADFPSLIAALGEVHPIRYVALVESIGGLLIRGAAPIGSLYDALRWVHFVDKLYDRAVSLAITSTAPLGELIPKSFLTGPYAKKFSRCLSRMEEMLGERGAEPS